MKPAHVKYGLQETTGVPRSALLTRAREIILARQKRAEIFGQGMFSEHAWDMLIILYLAAVDRQLSAGQLARLARAPMTTALRWLDYLETQQLVIRESHPTDRRCISVSISDKGTTLVNLYLYETLNLAP